MIPNGLAIKCIDNHSERFLRNWTTLLKKTSLKMMNLLKQACQDHYKIVKKGLIYSLEKLKTTCADTTFNHINNFLKVTKDELCHTLETRCNRKRIPNGRFSCHQALCFQNNITNSNATATNNTSPAHNISVTPTPHINHNILTHTRRHQRRSRRNKRVTRYWRQNNHNIQLDTNSVINLITSTISRKTQILPYVTTNRLVRAG